MHDYFSQCHRRIDGFTRVHFSLGGAIRIHRHALGRDLLTAPLNVLLALPAVLLRLTAIVLKRTRWRRFASKLERVPLSLQTNVERSLIQRLADEVFGLRTEDATISATSTDPKTVARLRTTHFNTVFEISLRRYAATRAAAADVTTALIAGLCGLIFLDSFSPGSFSVGRALADALTLETAIQNFWLGNTLGSWYYKLFAPDTSALLTAGSILLVMLLLSVCAAFAGVLADPVQRLLGIHKRRLRRLVNSLESAASKQGTEPFSPADQYVARATDVFDFFRGLWPG